MSLKQSRTTAQLILLLLATSIPLMWLSWRYLNGDQRSSGDAHAVRVKLQVEDAKETVHLVQNDDGTFSFVLERGDRSQETISPAELAERLYRQETSRGWVMRLFNIYSPIGFAWVSIGLLGQVLFTGRMIVQWLISERSRRSVVPPIFWWMSLLGALMLLVYFLWRRDIVGVLGQSFGLIVYLRNIYFIHAHNRDETE